MYNVNMYCEFPCVHNPSLGQSWTSYESEQRGLIKPSHFDHFGLFVKAQEPITQVLHPSTPPNPGFDLNLRHLKAISALTLVNWLAYTVIYHPYGEKIAKFWYMVGLQNGNIWCIYICIYIYILLNDHRLACANSTPPDFATSVLENHLARHVGQVFCEGNQLSRNVHGEQNTGLNDSCLRVKTQTRLEKNIQL